MKYPKHFGQSGHPIPLPVARTIPPTKIKIITEATLKYNLIGEDRVRLRLMEAGWYNFLEAPYFGKGAVEHTSFFYEYNLKHLGVWAQNSNTHNYFLFVLCSGGIFALILFIFPFLYNYFKSFHLLV